MGLSLWNWYFGVQIKRLKVKHEITWLFTSCHFIIWKHDLLLANHHTCMILIYRTVCTYWNTSLAVVKTNLWAEYRDRPTTNTMSLMDSLSNNSWYLLITCFPSSMVSSDGSFWDVASYEEQTLFTSIVRLDSVHISHH